MMVDKEKRIQEILKKYDRTHNFTKDQRFQIYLGLLNNIYLFI